ncbi:unnamed protein product [Owenia fusiformis]|uniref:Uncharacterized protein n=1 Tax=Owenia fusiformis TaxID=6347 RepID=A0A8J1TYZ6_OWEFU|nr:unnamed protein product [Owenia fusiformis]
MASSVKLEDWNDRQKIADDIERLKLALQDGQDSEYDSEDEDGFVMDDNPDDEAEGGDAFLTSPNDVSYTSRLQSPSRESPEMSQSSGALPGLPEDTENISLEDLPVSEETCLALNRAYQEVIAENMKRIELVLTQNRERQTQIEEEHRKDASKKDEPAAPKNRISVYTSPYFKDVNLMNPPPNQDTRLKQLKGQLDPHMKCSTKWKNRDKQILVKAIKQDRLQALLLPYMTRMEIEHEKLSKAAMPDLKEEIRARIEDIKKDMARLKKNPPGDYLGTREESNKIDWMKISTINLDGSHNAKECELMWKHNLHVDVNKDPWSKEEEERLTCLVQEYNGKEWPTIASKLNTNRTPFECLKYYQSNLNPELTNTNADWTEDEEDLLAAVVDHCRLGDHISYRRVAYYMEGKNQNQCISKWRKMDPNKRHGQWTKVEDQQLMEAVKTFGGRDWWKIQQHVPGRDQVQCHERWNSMIDPLIHKGPWTLEEDEALLNLVEKTGKGSWSTIAKNMPTRRIDNACLLRYKRLMLWKQQNEWLLEQTPETVNYLLWNRRTAIPSTRAQEDDLDAQMGQDEELAILRQVKSEKNKEDLLEELMEAPKKPKSDAQARLDKAVANKAKVVQKKWTELDKERLLVLQQAELIKQGRMVPRPPRTTVTRLADVAGKQKTVMSQIEKSVVGKLKSQDKLSKARAKAVGETLRLKSNKKNKMGVELSAQLLNVDHNMSVRDMLKLAREVRKEVLGQSKPPKVRGRPVLANAINVRQVEHNLMKMLRNRVTKQLKAGRPRKHFLNDRPLTNAGAKETYSLTAENKVANLMFKALRVDTKRCLSIGPELKDVGFHNLMMRETEKEQIKLKADKELTEALREGQKPCVRNNILNKHKLKRAAMEKKVREQMWALSSLEEDFDTVTQVAAMQGVKEIKDELLDEYKNQVIAKSADDGPKRKKAMRAEEYVEIDETDDTKELNLMSPPITKLPPLPPNITTINAFKMLLLNRKKLVKRAGSLYEPPKLGKKTADDASKDSNENTEDEDLSPPSDTDQPGSSSQVNEHAQSEDIFVKIEPGENAQVQNQARKPRNNGILKRVKKTSDYQALKARFSSLFLWPALLSTIGPKEEEIPNFPIKIEPEKLGIFPQPPLKQATRVYKELAAPNSTKYKKRKYACLASSRKKKFNLKSRLEKAKFKLVSLQGLATRYKDHEEWKEYGEAIKQYREEHNIVPKNVPAANKQSRKEKLKASLAGDSPPRRKSARFIAKQIKKEISTTPSPEDSIPTPLEQAVDVPMEQSYDTSMAQPVVEQSENAPADISEGLINVKNNPYDDVNAPHESCNGLYAHETHNGDSE